MKKIVSKNVRFIVSVLVLLLGVLHSNAQVYVDIPDENFKNYLLAQPNINTFNDGEITYTEAANFAGEIDCNNLNITDLKGIEAFTQITLLYCYQNQLTSLDVSQNTALTTLICSANPLTSLILGQIGITSLYCNQSQLTSLDVSQNTALTTLSCYENSLTSLALGANIALTTLRCEQNLLTNLDVSHNTTLTTLYCHENRLTSLDISKNTALIDFRCHRNQLTSLDVSKNVALTTLTCNGNLLTSLDLRNSNNSKFTTLQTSQNPNLTCVKVDDVAYSTVTWVTNFFQFPPNVLFSVDCIPITTSIHEINEHIMNMYPNPVNNVLTIETKSPLNVWIVNMLGETVISTMLNDQRNNLDVSHLTEGIYFLKSEYDGVLKFIKE